MIKLFDPIPPGVEMTEEERQRRMAIMFKKDPRVARTEAFFFDKNHEPCSVDEAVYSVYLHYDKDGNEIEPTIFNDRG